MSEKISQFSSMVWVFMINDDSTKKKKKTLHSIFFFFFLRVEQLLLDCNGDENTDLDFLDSYRHR